MTINPPISIVEDEILLFRTMDGRQLQLHLKIPPLLRDELGQLTHIQLVQVLEFLKRLHPRLYTGLILNLRIFHTGSSPVALKNVNMGSISADTVSFGDIVYNITKENKIPRILSSVIPPRNPADIIGREKDLEDLHRLLSTEQRVVLVNGIGGIGKTTLAQVYVHTYYYQYEHILWITQSSEDITRDFIHTGGLAANLGIDWKNLEPEQIWEEMIRRLKGIEEHPNLLIIDNAEGSLKNWISQLPAQPQWHLLVTSRETIPGFHSRPLGFLGEEEAIALFRRYYQHKELSEEDVRNLVRAVDFHTLLIEILAKTAELMRYDIYTLTRAIEEDLLTDIETFRNQHPEKIERVGSYLSSLFSLSKLSEEEVALLQQFVCMPPEFIPRDLLLQLTLSPPRSGSPSGTPAPDILGLSTTLASVTRKGWLLNTPQSDSYKMHRIIADAVRRNTIITPVRISSLAENLTRRLVVDPLRDNPADKYAWIPFGKALLAAFPEETPPALILLQYHLAILLQHLGNYEEAKEHLQKGLESSTRHFGATHPNTALLMTNLGSVLRDLDEYAAARVLLEQATDYYEQQFGIDDPRTIECYGRLAGVLLDQGDNKRTAWMGQKYLRYAQQLGTAHINFAGSQFLLGQLHASLGRYDSAKVLLESAVRSNENRLGKDHPNTARSYNHLGLAYGKVGNYTAAKNYLQKALQANLNTFGPSHPRTSIVYSNLGFAYRDTGEYEEAYRFFLKALEADRPRLDPEDTLLLQRYSHLAIALQYLDRFGEALLLQEKVIAVQKKVLGEDAPELSIDYYDLAYTLSSLSRFTEAEALLQKALDIFIKAYGEDHPDTLDSYTRLGNFYIKLQQYEKAFKVYAPVLEKNVQRLGWQHTTVAVSCINLATALEGLKDYRRARNLLETAKLIYIHHYGKNNPKAANIYYRLSIVLKKQEDYTGAQALAGKAVEIAEDTLGLQHPTTSQYRQQLALVLRKSGDLVLAKEILQQQVISYGASLGKEHSLTAGACMELGLVLIDLGSDREAKIYLEQAVRVYMKVYGPDHTETAIGYSNLALALAALGDTPEAIRLTEKGLNILRPLYPPDSKDILTMESNLKEFLSRVSSPSVNS